MSSTYLTSLDSDPNRLEIDDAAAKLSAADLKEVVALITVPPEKDERDVRILSPKAAAKLVPLVPDKALSAFVRRLGVLESHALQALSDAQLRTAYQWSVEAHRAFREGKKWANDKSPDLTFELMRRGQFTAKDLKERIALFATGEQYEVWRHFVQAARERTTIGAPSLPAWVQSLADAHAGIAPLGASLREWWLGVRASVAATKLDDPDVMFLVAATWREAEDVAWLAGLFAAGKWTGARDRETATRQLATAFAGRTDGAAIIAGLKKALKGKRLTDMMDNAAAQLAALRVHVKGDAAATAVPVALDWSRIATDEAVTLVRAAKDPVAMLSAAAETTDPVALLNVWHAIYRITWVDFVQKKVKKPLVTPIALLVQLVGALAEHYGDAAPDGKALSQRIGVLQAGRAFTDGLDLALSIRRTIGDEMQQLQDAVLRAFGATKNRRFKGWVESRVATWQPALEETVPQKLARLAAETSREKLVSRTVVVRDTDEDAVPFKADINRLYGQPIGVTAATWPKFGKAKMEHVITLETRLLSTAAQKALGKDCAAIAVFLSSLRDHDAFAPGSPRAAIVKLTAADVATAASPGDDGVRLLVATADVPEKVFLGGKKSGPIAELRTLFDREDFLVPDRGSPRWLQSAQPARGAFLFELDDRFAGRVNMGDGGRLYVFADTAFVQST
ncbi:MAG TPA: hypothetical protein VGM90_26000 [Kofleriaceae bacterium]